MRLKQDISDELERIRATEDYADICDTLREEFPGCDHEKIGEFIVRRLLFYAQDNDGKPLTADFIREVYEDAVERWPELSDLLDEQ